MTSNKRFVFKLVMVLLIFLLGFSALFLGMNAIENYFVKKSDSALLSNLPNDIFGHVKYNGKTYKPKNRIETVLLIGLDNIGKIENNNSYTNSQQADFLALLVIDKISKECTLIHINRDTMTDIPVLGFNGDKVGTMNTQIALSHTYGSGREDSCRNTADAVSELLYGVRIDNYMSLTMGAVGTLNDLIGGVEVEILEDFSSVDPAMIKGETVKLKSEQALSYIRMRKGIGDQSNLSRMERQKQYVSSFISALKAEYTKDNKLVLNALDSVGDYMVTDMTVQELTSLSEYLSSYSFNGILSPKGESVLGDVHIEHYIDSDALTQLVLDIFYKEVD